MDFHHAYWGVYLVAVAIMLIVVWRQIKTWKIKWLGEILLAALIALFLTPWSAIPEQSSIAPAVIIMVFEGFADANYNAWRGGLPILVVFCLLLLIIVFGRWVATRKRAKLAGNMQADSAQQTDLEKTPSRPA